MKKIILLAAVTTSLLMLAIPVILFSNKRTQKLSSIKTTEQFTAYFQQANALHEKGDYAQAIPFYAQAIKINPAIAQVYYNLGLTFQKLNMPVDAIKMYKQTIKINPDYTNAYFQSAEILKKHKQHAQAVALIDTHLKTNPLQKESLLMKASIWYDQGKLEQACILCKDIVKQNPSYSEAYTMLGNIYEKLNDIPHAIDAHKKAVGLAPDNPLAHTALADGYLALGDYQNWGKEYEWRWRMKTFKKRVAPLWDGSDLKNKKILFITENGLGDTLQYIRFLPKLKHQGAQITVLAQKPLAKLLATFSCIDTLITDASQIPPVDFMSSVRSLPVYCAAPVKNCGETPYLQANPALIAHWKVPLSTDKKFKIGLCWQASTIDAQSIPQSRRTIPFETIAQLADIKNISLYSLQKNWPIEQLEKYGIKNFDPDFDEKNGAFMDTAAIMKNLDLIITVDTVTAHLAGALNVPVWMLTPLAADPRWMLNRSDTPWYPSMILFRQKKVSDWDSVIKTVKTSLEKKVNKILTQNNT
ncbi:hypothetical protein CVU75_02205 [Candidatus Dependentiae bacterium HGW-Dependentiae-1]|nr:MAG: hypothetical protein CVU75_02205 [Candidatus Dependentiae bacterium HGW-Dependentiae-1]